MGRLLPSASGSIPPSTALISRSASQFPIVRSSLLIVIVGRVWRLHGPWGRPDDHVVMDAPADDHQGNQDQDDAGHFNACNHGRDEPYARHDGEHTEGLLASPSHGLELPKNEAATREAASDRVPSSSRPEPPGIGRAPVHSHEFIVSDQTSTPAFANASFQ